MSILVALNASVSPKTLAVEPTISVGEGVSLALREDGVLFQFGGQPFTPITLGTVATPLQPDAAILKDIENLSISWKKDFPSDSEMLDAIVINSQGEVLTWNLNGSDIVKTNPTQVSGLSDIKEIILSRGNWFALTNTNTAFIFDRNNLSATSLTDLTDIKTIAPSYSTYVALTNIGTVYFGHQGEPDESTLIQELSNIKAVSISPDGASSALSEDGKVYMWSLDFLGDRNLLPVTQVPGLSGIAEIVAIDETPALALAENGGIYHWKWDFFGKTPIAGIPVSGLSNINTILNEDRFFVAVNQSGNVYIWGWDNSTKSPVDITQISGVSDVEIIDISSDDPEISTLVALTSQKEVYTWTWNFTTNTSTTAKQVGNLSNVIAIAAGRNHSLVLTDDGIVCGWGDNSNGQLGVNAPSSVSVTSPVCNIEDLIVPEVTLYSVTLNKTGNGTGTVTAPGGLDCGSTCNTDYVSGNTIMLAASADIGSEFTGWSGDCSGTDNPITMTINAPLNCIAIFDVAPNRTLTMATNGGSGTGIVTSSTGVNNTLNCGITCSEDFLHGSIVTLTAIADANSKFVGWIGTNCADIFTITTNMNCTARFDLLSSQTLTITKTGSGSGSVSRMPTGSNTCGDNCTEHAVGASITLTATPDVNSNFMGWSGNNDCKSGINSTTVTLNTDLSCTVNFGTGGKPNITVYPDTINFENANISHLSKQTIRISNNSSTAGLQLGTITLVGDTEFVLNDSCSNIGLAPYSDCEMTVNFQPTNTTTKTAILSIPSNDPDTSTVNVSLQGMGCSGDYVQPSVNIAPATLDFGTEMVGHSSSLKQQVYTWTQGCGTFQEIDTLEFTGLSATEFSIRNKHCYYGVWEKNSYSYCDFSIVFSPTSEGPKDAQLNFTFNDANIQTTPRTIQASAVIDGQPNIEILPNAHDFGSVVQSRSLDPQVFTITNTGNINLKIDQIATTRFEFQTFGWECLNMLPPSEQCHVETQFIPMLPFGNKQADLKIVSNVPTTTVPLTGTVTEAQECLPTNITIESSGNDNAWDSAETWNLARIPTENDVVLIKSGHTITGISVAKVRTLCIEEGGFLTSQDNLGTPLEIQATDYIENKGTIQGQNGAHEINSNTTCTSQTQVATMGCAQPGASVIIKVGENIRQYVNYVNNEEEWWYSYIFGGPITNIGQIIAGHGGNANQYAAPGGDAIVLGRDTNNQNLIQAGNGGNILGRESGKAGNGGITQVWGKLGGPGHLYNQNGAQILAGKGGNCNASATAFQIGGQGGNLRLISSDVYLSGTHEAGIGGIQCVSADSLNGENGEIVIEPSIIDLSGTNTNVSGGNISIYGGNDWTLDLSRINNIVINASGDITLAVGENGVIDLSGNTSTILKADGQVTLFSDNILWDEDFTLYDLIDASNIVVGPSKILRNVSLTGESQYTGLPEEMLPVRLTLANNGPEADTYTISVTDTAGWNLSQLPSTIEVKGLTSIDLVLNVKLPASHDERNVITVTANSQNDSEVIAIADMQVMVTQENAIIPTPLPKENGTKDTTIATVVSNPLQGLPKCLSISRRIDNLCSNHWQVIIDATVEKSAIIAGGKLAGNLTNKGIISQVAIQAGAIVSGGKVTGNIKNEGTLADFEFVGYSIKGGTLAGTIFNNSQVNGFFQDVQLAPNTHIIGGIVKGEIQGDCEAPARLENVTVKPGSQLSCVILDGDEALLEGVTFGQGVQFSQLIIAGDNSEEMSTALPPLTEAIAINVQGEILTTDAQFAGGISHNGHSFEPSATVNFSDLVEIRGHISVATEHLEQPLEILVVVAKVNTDSDSAFHYSMIDSNGNGLTWDGNMGSLVPFQTAETSEQPIEVPIYNGSFAEIGVQHFYFGYRLADGMVVYSPQSLEVTISK